jgi:hypothetical protein
MESTMGSMSMGMDITSATVTLIRVENPQHCTIRISVLVRIGTHLEPLKKELLNILVSIALGRAL